MQYYSTNGQVPSASFQEALFRGLAPDGGLYMPSSIPQLPEGFFEELHTKTLPEIGTAVAGHFVEDEIPGADLEALVGEAMNFEIPLVNVEEQTHTLELFHGPTRSFKDVGARFMSRAMGWFNRGGGREVTVLVATSGDTGSAVANGFLGVEGVRVVLLYPSGKVSHIQEQQLTTLGQNITALEVEGVFDDCQRMVKAAFVDQELSQALRLTSANSISIGRLIPQSFYYFHAVGQLGKGAEPPVICVPSGNFGNLTGGLIAHRMGLDVARFVAATNANAVVPDYLASGEFQPRPSVRTLSNAMDVGNPSNFVRMLELFDHDVDKMRATIQGHAFDDRMTMHMLAFTQKRTGYLMDPHGAVGLLGLLKSRGDHHGPEIFLETAHPAKFGDVIEEHLGEPVPLPDDLAVCLQKTKQTVKVGSRNEDLKAFLMDVVR
ncbi:MAG: threonine synthase [Bacteroidota bacterium]